MFFSKTSNGLEFSFVTKCSALEPYITTVIADSGSLHINCTCAAGHQNQLCKHIYSLINGDKEVTDQLPLADYASFQKHYLNSGLSLVIGEIALLETEVEQLKRRIANHKKKAAKLCANNNRKG